jgi:hypothetical protein
LCRRDGGDGVNKVEDARPPDPARGLHPEGSMSTNLLKIPR